MAQVLGWTGWLSVRMVELQRCSTAHVKDVEGMTLTCSNPAPGSSLAWPDGYCYSLKVEQTASIAQQMVYQNELLQTHYHSGNFSVAVPEV